MAKSSIPTMFVIAGPNGSGKSTLYETRIAPKLAIPFINADHIQEHELKDPSPEASYEAARIAEERRRDFLKQGKSFVTESVFSHPSKLALVRDAKAAGFRVVLFHISVREPTLSVARVAERVREGGHDVPTDKIRERYRRSAPLIRQAALLADVAHVYDNSSLNQPPRRVLSFNNGNVEFIAEAIPDWVLQIYREDRKSKGP